MKLNLIDIVSSPQDLRALILEIRKYAAWLAQNDVKARVGGKKETGALDISPSAAGLIEQLAREQTVTQKLLEELITVLEDYQAKAPRITITLAAVPPGSLKKTLVAWCRENISPDILVDFSFNRTILGGMVVRYGSHVHDWSFRRQIMAGRAKFPEVLRRV